MSFGLASGAATGGFGFGGGTRAQQPGLQWSTGTFPGATGQPQDMGEKVTGETSYAKLPPYIQAKIYEAYQRIEEHRKKASEVSQFSAQPSDLDLRTKKLKLDILRVQNAETEISLAAEGLRKDVDRIRSHLQKIQSGDLWQEEYSNIHSRRDTESWQKQHDDHAEILEQIVSCLEGRLSDYDSYIQEVYRKIMSHAQEPAPLVSRRYGRREEGATPEQVATLIRMQSEAVLRVGGQVAAVHEMVERLRSHWMTRTGVDPFIELERIAAEEEERKRKAAKIAPPVDVTSAAIFQLGMTAATGAAVLPPASVSPLSLGVGNSSLGSAGTATGFSSLGMGGGGAGVAGVPPLGGGLFGTSTPQPAQTGGMFAAASTGGAGTRTSRANKRNMRAK